MAAAPSPSIDPPNYGGMDGTERNGANGERKASERGRTFRSSRNPTCPTAMPPSLRRFVHGVYTTVTLSFLLPSIELALVSWARSASRSGGMRSQL